MDSSRHYHHQQQQQQHHQQQQQQQANRKRQAPPVPGASGGVHRTAANNSNGLRNGITGASGPNHLANGHSHGAGGAGGGVGVGVGRISSSGISPAASTASASSADDLHAWSLFRQNLNANFSNSAQAASNSSSGSGGGGHNGSHPTSQTTSSAHHHHHSRSSNSPLNNNSNKSQHHHTPTGGASPPSNVSNRYPLRDSTVSALLSNPKYGEQMKNQDTFTYLRFGLPRVKVTNPRSALPPTEPPIIDHQPPSRQQQHAPYAQEFPKHSSPLKYSWAQSNNNHHSPEGRISELDSSGKDSDGSGREILPSSARNNRKPIHRSHIDLEDTEFETELDEPVAKVLPHKSRYPRSSKEQLHQSQLQEDSSDETLHPELGKIPGSYLPSGRDPYEEDIRLDEMLSSHPPLAKHPHLVVKDLIYELDKSANWRRLCGFSRQKLRVLEDINFDVLGGELLAVMATNEYEGTALLDVLTDRFDRRNGHVRAEMYLNGVSVNSRTLARVSAYVAKTAEFSPDMTTRQALLFAGMLLTPAQTPRGSSGDIKRRTRTILEELNLGDVQHTRIAELTESERRRLQIATHLLLDTELLILDQPLDGLDIFDAFFLVEYLRQWAAVGGRIVIMTLHPPTYEVFTMLNKVLLLSAGRSLFVGARRDLLKHFTSMDFGCPPYKNPSDYYLDLVTMDSLSQEALIESSQRIEALADVQSRKPLTELFTAMPGPPAVLPAPFRRANFAMQFLALWIRALIFCFPYNIVRLFSRFMGAMIVSLAIGAVYWQVRTGREQEFVWDRVGFVTTMLTVGILPVLLSDIWSAFKEKCVVESEVEQRFYSLPAYLFAKILYSAPSSILVGFAYVLPACSMAGLHLHLEPNSLSLYLLLMIGYYMALRMAAIGLVWACRKRSTATGWFGILFTVWTAASGAIIQVRDIAFTHRWLRAVSPIRWIHEAFIGWEFEPNGSPAGPGLESALPSASSAFLCSRNPVVQQPNAILVRADCGFQTRANILKWFDYSGGNSSTASASAAAASSAAQASLLYSSSSSSAVTSSNAQDLLRPWWHALIAFAILYTVSFIMGSIIFCLRSYYFRSDADKRRHSSSSSSTFSSNFSKTDHRRRI